MTRIIQIKTVMATSSTTTTSLVTHIKVWQESHVVTRRLFLFARSGDTGGLSINLPISIYESSCEFNLEPVLFHAANMEFGPAVAAGGGGSSKKGWPQSEGLYAVVPMVEGDRQSNNKDLGGQLHFRSY